VLSGRFQGSPRAGRAVSGTGGTGYAVVDLEATGPNPKRHRVVEVAVVLLDRDCRVEGEFSTLLDPAGPVGPTHIHGIAGHDTEGAPAFADIAPYLLRLLHGRVLVGHHVNCDRGFLVGEYSRLGVVFPDVPTLCTMRLAADHLPALATPSLRACCAAAGLPAYAEHTALGDAHAAAALLGHYAARDRLEERAWNQVLLEAVGLQWPVMASGGVPRTWHRSDARGLKGNVWRSHMVPVARKGSA
jgi:DNA polymerase III epsilon subunit-like protein